VTRVGYRVRGRVLPRFVEAGAVAPADAIAFVPEARDAAAFAQLRAAGVIRGRDGAWWFDAVAWASAEEARSRRAVPYLIGGAVVAAALLTLFYQG
jgi:hypothetical protein